MLKFWQERLRKIDLLWDEGGWLARILIFLSVGAGVWCFGLFWKWPQGFAAINHFPRLDDFLKLCADPLTRDLNEPIVAYRITTPVIAKILGLGPKPSALLAWLALGISYSVCWVALRRATNSLFALIIVFTLSQTFYAHTSIRWLGLPDSVTLLALACCLVLQRPWTFAISTLLGMMNDERFLIAIPGLVVWKVVIAQLSFNKNYGKSAALSLSKIWLETKNMLSGIALGLLATLLLRHALTVGWIGEGIQKPGIYLAMTEQAMLERAWQPYGSNWPFFLINILFSWSWMWIYLRYLFLKGLFPANALFAFGAFTYLLVAAASTALVIDVSRSMGFLFPLFLAGAVVFYLSQDDNGLKGSWLLAVLMAATPGIYYGAHGSGAVFIPYPLDLGNNLLSHLTGHDFLGDLKKIFAFRPGS